MDVVAVLSGVDAEQGLVGREPSLFEPLDLHLEQPDREHVNVAVDLLRRSAALGDVDRETAAVGEHAGHQLAADRQALRPSRRRTGKQITRLAAFEGRRHPSPGLVAGRIGEPDDLAAVSGDGRVDDADRFVRKTPPFTRR